MGGTFDNFLFPLSHAAFFVHYDYSEQFLSILQKNIFPDNLHHFMQIQGKIIGYGFQPYPENCEKF